MAVKTDPTTASAAWVSGMQGASTKYKAGVAAVRTAPGQLAAAAANLWATNVANAKSKYQRNVAAVSLSQWQDAATNKGADRLGSGAVAAQPKFDAFMAKFIPALSNIVNALPPRGDFGANMTRFQQFATNLHNQKGNF